MTRYHARTRGSVRFAPYYKLQWWDVVSLVWREIQEQFPTVGSVLDATGRFAGAEIVASRAERVRLAIPTDSAFRVVEVAESGRRVIAEQERLI